MQLISDKIRRLWTVRLAEEHRTLCWRHGLELKKPLIEIVSSSRIWGRYRSQDNTIQISEQLIVNHCWDVVLQVFKHEMAHQAVAELHRTADGHGRLFREACGRLGLAPGFARASGDLPRTLEVSANQEHSVAGRLHRRVAKLLNLASSDNPHEAELALEKAGLLIARYNLRFLSESEEGDYSYRIIKLDRKNVTAAQRIICSLLRRYFFVEVVLSSLYDAESLQTCRTVELLGKIENIETAEYVFHFLENRLQSLWEAHRKTTNCRVGKKKAYLLGILNGFASQLERRFASAGATVSRSNQTAIAVSPVHHDAALQKIMQRRHPLLQRSRMARCQLDGESYAAGKRKGESLSFYRPICAKTSCDQLIKFIPGEQE